MLGQLWWYIWLGASSIPTEEAAPLIGGLRAEAGHLQPSLVVLSIILWIWALELGLYYLGRWRGDWVRKRYPHARRFMLGAFRIVRRHPWRSSFATRFAYGIRLVLPIACGAARVPIVLYTVATGISSVIWTVAFVALGWVFGQSAELVLGHVQRYEHVLIGVIVVAIIVGYVVIRRRHVEDGVVEVLAKGDPGPVPRVSEPHDHG